MPNLSKAEVLQRYPVVERACSLLTDKHQCHTLVLYGSFARGDATAESDVDILGISDAALEEFRISDSFEDAIDLDVFVHPTQQIESLSGQDLSKLRGGVLLADPLGLGQMLVAKGEEWSKNPPKVLSPWARAQSISWCKRMAKRASRGDTEGDYRRHWLAMEILPIWFELRQLHFFGPKESLQWLQSNEPRVFAKFEKAYLPKANPEDLFELVGLLED